MKTEESKIRELLEIPPQTWRDWKRDSKRKNIVKFVMCFSYEDVKKRLEK